MRVGRTAFFRRSARWLVGGLLLAVGVLWTVQSAALGAQPAGVYEAEEVHAVFLLNFANFCEWPREALPDGAPLVIGVAGSRALEDELLARTERQQVQDRRVRVVRVNSARDLAGLHVLYVGGLRRPGDDTAPTAAELLPQLRRMPVLTVSESPTFLAEGGIVNLYAGPGGRLRFEIALKHANEAGLVLSSRVLSLARIVDPAEPTPAAP